MEKKRSLTLRLEERVYRAYRVWLAERGRTAQEDLEECVLRRLQDAGRLPKDERPR
ncbi:hypothetical protein [Caldinitratiruptor microaerophilus]|uniref:Uncharacterized protein n=1 Tax=Caldinitratiruptor microaerophilus TaxID=671077 RepID=A0AA35CK66_9FIRM|nr:hypothetical protein [Caldinitratiruptor microaerophilus]BDG59908.1 hypothetical protein caldi_09980 [Caldinitratiruptor microaerophilus]